MKESKPCNNELIITTVGQTLQLPSKFCILERGHAGPHHDGAAWWHNTHRHIEDLERGIK